jgi:DNA (cytosine-5)-methyltransferase 1
MKEGIDTSKKVPLRGISLFSSAGIGEIFLSEVGVDIVVANELIPERAELYSKIYNKTNMITGDINNDTTFKKIVDSSGKIDIIIATPPCQGMSVAGKNRTQQDMVSDKRNYLVFRTIELIKIKKPRYILIENVPNFLEIKLPYNGTTKKLIDILNNIFDTEYDIQTKILNTAEYGIPQKRIRAVVIMSKKGLKWDWPKKEQAISVKSAIGHLPSLESSQSSNIPWHFSRKHSDNHVIWMKHTPTGHSAFENEVFFPQKKDGQRVKGYITTYRRMKWDEPAPTITMRNDAISSQMNVHPGRKLDNGEYSDARVLTPLELMVLSSIPESFKIPDGTPEILIRKCIGECVPPLLIKKILKGISR